MGLEVVGFGSGWVQMWTVGMRPASRCHDEGQDDPDDPRKVQRLGERRESERAHERGGTAEEPTQVARAPPDAARVPALLKR